MEAVQELKQAKTATTMVGIKNAGWVIIGCFIVAVCIYYFLLGNPANFVNNDPNKIQKCLGGLFCFLHCPKTDIFCYFP